MKKTPDFGDLPEWARWLAQDRDGSWWAYEHEPNTGAVAWYENEVGRSRRLLRTQENAEWERALLKIKI
jgi:hypothetical protein